MCFDRAIICRSVSPLASTFGWYCSFRCLLNLICSFSALITSHRNSIRISSMAWLISCWTWKRSLICSADGNALDAICFI